MMRKSAKEFLKRRADQCTSKQCLPRRISVGRSARAAFTIVELLVVAAVIILLLSLLIVALNAAARTSQISRTQALMASMKKGLIQFKEEVGYYPPVLGDYAPTINNLRELWPPPDPDSSTYPQNNLHWYSYTSAAEYLLGYGSHREDGYGVVSDAPDISDWHYESPPVGIRHPGHDGVWGAGNNTLLHRMYGNGIGGGWSAETPNPVPANYPSPLQLDVGKVYGPYIELNDERLLAAIVDINTTDPDVPPVLAFPGDQLPAGTTWESLPKTIVDYWGSPIRYYRRAYPPGALSQSYRAGIDRDPSPSVVKDYVPTLSDFFFLRPWNIKSSSDTTARLPDGNGSNATTFELEAGEFALFSPGPDLKVDKHVRVDAGDPPHDKEVNKDNIVEVGP